MSSSSLELSFDATALLHDHEIDTAEFMPESPSAHYSPLKKQRAPPPQTKQLGHQPTPCLPPLPTSFSSSDLFQMTHHLRDGSHGHQLHDNKIAKLIDSLQRENDEFELDDTLRTRVFRGRFSKASSAFDAFDMQLDSFLRDDAVSMSPVKKRAGPGDDDKENVHPVPSKRKLSDSHRKAPLKKARSFSSIPLLPSAGSDLAYNFKSRRPGQALASPQRVCIPRHAASPGKPNLKLRKHSSILLVDSSTGSVSDATQFGTELNSSNCEGFPLPEDVNEIVQIPTNETTPASAVQKMAIIKAVHGRTFASASQSGQKGFYTKDEFDNRSKPVRPKTLPAKKSVRWADELEW